MKNLLATLFLFFSSILLAYAELLDKVQWAKTLSNNHDLSCYGNIIPLDARNCLIFTSSNNKNIFVDNDSPHYNFTYNHQIYKINSYGKIVSKDSIIAVNPDIQTITPFFYDFCFDRDNNIIMNGDFNDTIAFSNNIILENETSYSSRFLAKYNENGKCLWAKKIMDKSHYSNICTDNENNIYMICSFYDTLKVDNFVLLGIKFNENVAVMKFGPDGKCLWARVVTIYSPRYNKGEIFTPSSLNIDNGNLYFISFDYQYIVSDTMKMYYSPYGEGFGVVQVNAWNGDLKDVFHIGSTAYFSNCNVRNNKIYLSGIFDSEITIGKATLSSNESVYPMDYNGFLLKYDIDSGNIIWLKQVKSDKGSLVPVNNTIGQQRSLCFFKDNLYLVFTFSGGTLILDDRKLPLRGKSFTSALVVCDTNGNWQESDYVSSESWVSQGVNLNSAGNIYLRGYYTDSAHINDKIVLRNKGSQYFLLKIGDKCSSASFSYPGFSGISDINAVSKAKTDSTILMLTPSGSQLEGAAWRKEKAYVANGFSTSFTFRMNKGYNSFEDGSSPGGDGIAFVIQNSGPNVVGKNGGGIGYAGISNSLAIEFDTYRNEAFDQISDPNGSHIAVFSAGKETNVADHKSSACLGVKDIVPELKADGALRFAKIDYDAGEKKLYVYLDSTDNFTARALVVDNIDLSKLLDMPDGKAFVGFTSSTGTAIETHEILDWDFCQPADESTTDVEDNIPNQQNLSTIYPNPFSYIAVVDFTMKNEGYCEIHLCDVLGNELQQVFSGNLEAGEHKFNISSDGLSNGIYFVRLKTGNDINVIKTEIIK